MLPHAHITLSELQRLVKETLHERFALPVWVSAEISEVKVNYRDTATWNSSRKGAITACRWHSRAP